MLLSGRPDIVDPSGTVRPDLVGPSGHIHKHVPPQYHVNASGSSDMIFRLFVKNAPFRSCTFVILLRLGCVTVGPWARGPRPIT